MRKLARQSFIETSRSINHYARPLERAIFEFRFQNSKAESVVEKLREFQNDDGGFGNGIESDFRLPYSSPLATSVGIRLLSEIDGLEEAGNMIRKAIEYLQVSFDEERIGWFAVPEEVNAFPHAPWWHYDERERMTAVDMNWGNPTAEILGYLHKYENYVTNLNVDAMIKYAVEYMKKKESFSSEHEVYCFIKLYEVLPENLKKRLEERIQVAVSQLVNYDEGEWDKYVPQPIDFVKGPEKCRFGIEKERINDNLRHVIDRIEQGGKLIPPWGKKYYEGDLAAAYSEWIGVLTLEGLTTLHNFNRIEDGRYMPR